MATRHSNCDKAQAANTTNKPLENLKPGVHSKTQTIKSPLLQAYRGVGSQSTAVQQHLIAAGIRLSSCQEGREVAAAAKHFSSLQNQGVHANA